MLSTSRWSLLDSYGSAQRDCGGELVDPEKVERMAAEYTAARNFKSAAAVAAFYAEDGEIIINRGIPWTGRLRVQDMAAGY